MSRVFNSCDRLPLDEEKATREVAAALRSVAHLLRSYTTPDLVEASYRLEQIAGRMEALVVRTPEADEKGSPPDLVSDTLVLLENFRQIESPVVRRAAISMIRALRPSG